MEPMDKIKEVQARHAASLQRMIDEAKAMQDDAKYDLPKLRRLLDAFIPTSLEEQRILRMLGVSLRWREDVRKGVPFQKAFLDAYGDKP